MGACMNKKLQKIMKEFIDDFLEKKKDPILKEYIVKRSIPIVYFGDFEAYKKSKRKIVTIGLNPSDGEFPDNERRFQIINFNKGNEEENVLNLYKTLNDYFKVNPYSWFKRGEYVLNTLGATYYQEPLYDCGFKRNDTALHLDIYSSIATQPTWNRLGTLVKKEIQNIELFRKLLNYLDPDIILISTNKNVFNQCFGDFSLIKERSRIGSNNYYVRKYIKNNKQVLWFSNINGTAFGLSHEFIKKSVSELMNK